jgi:hypothetical protein
MAGQSVQCCPDRGVRHPGERCLLGGPHGHRGRRRGLLGPLHENFWRAPLPGPVRAAERVRLDPVQPCPQVGTRLERAEAGIALA